jgi:hypothetical protein
MDGRIAGAGRGVGVSRLVVGPRASVAAGVGRPGRGGAGGRGLWGCGLWAVWRGRIG